MVGVFEPDVYLGDGCPPQPAQGQGRCGQRRRPIPQPYPGTECRQAAVGTSCIIIRVPTALGKQGEWPKEVPVRENMENLEIWSKHRENREFGLLN